jgi:hypothetical protein
VKGTLLIGLHHLAVGPVEVGGRREARVGGGLAPAGSAACRYPLPRRTSVFGYCGNDGQGRTSKVQVLAPELMVVPLEASLPVTSKVTA